MGMPWNLIPDVRWNRFLSMLGTFIEETQDSLGDGVSSQRVESVEFTRVLGTTNQQRRQTLAPDPVEVVFGDGDAELVEGTAGEDTFTMLEAGVYEVEWVATVTPGATDPVPCMEIQDSGDNSVLALLY